jgi:hypothetical protein
MFKILGLKVFLVKIPNAGAALVFYYLESHVRLAFNLRMNFGRAEFVSQWTRCSRLRSGSAEDPDPDFSITFL